MRHILKSHTSIESRIKHEPEEKFVMEEMSDKIDAVMYECSACGKVLTTKWGKLIIKKNCQWN